MTPSPGLAVFVDYLLGVASQICVRPAVCRASTHVPGSDAAAACLRGAPLGTPKMKILPVPLNWDGYFPYATHTFAAVGISQHPVGPLDIFSSAILAPDGSQSITVGPTDELHTSQIDLDPESIEHYVEHGPDELLHTGQSRTPQVYRHQGKLWIWEGHHRLTAARIRGEVVQCHFRDVDAEQAQNSDYLDDMATMDYDDREHLA